MKPHISDTKFGSITIENKVIEHDVVIRSSGAIEKRKKKLSKSVYGTSHLISLKEAKYIYEKGANRIVIGTGQNGLVTLSDEAQKYFKKKKCSTELLLTPKAVSQWNKAKGNIIGLFHVTC
jgi:hypothetical protein